MIAVVLFLLPSKRAARAAATEDATDLLMGIIETDRIEPEHQYRFFWIEMGERHHNGEELLVRPRRFASIRMHIWAASE